MSVSVRRWVGLVLSVVALMVGLSASAMAANSLPNLGILVVCDPSNAKMKSLEDQATAAIKLLRNNPTHKIPTEKLPILAYHWNNATERKYCEQKLGIKQEDLLFVALCEQDNYVVKKIHWEHSFKNVQDPNSRAYKLFRDIALSFGIKPKDIPAPPGTTTIADTPQNGEAQVYVIDGTGQSVSNFTTDDESVFFDVFLNKLPDDGARHNLHLVLKGTQPSDVDQLPVIGGDFTVTPDMNGRDLLAAVSEGGTGFKISDPVSPLGDRADDYTVTAVLDGKPVAENHFHIAPKEMPGIKGLALCRLFTSDENGKPKTTFSVADKGVFIFCFLTNTASEAMLHNIQIKLYTSDHSTVSSTLGGPFSVAKGEDLGKKEYPADADPKASNGWLLAGHELGNRPGDYIVNVELDGKQIKEIPITITK